MTKLLFSLMLVAALAVVTSIGCASTAGGGSGSHAGHNH